jgi:hypothetical protein
MVKSGWWSGTAASLTRRRVAGFFASAGRRDPACKHRGLHCCLTPQAEHGSPALPVPHGYGGTYGRDTRHARHVREDHRRTSPQPATDSTPSGPHVANIDADLAGDRIGAGSAAELDHVQVSRLCRAGQRRKELLVNGLRDARVGMNGPKTMRVAVPRQHERSRCALGKRYGKPPPQIGAQMPLSGVGNPHSIPAGWVAGRVGLAQRADRDRSSEPVRHRRGASVSPPRRTDAGRGSR